MSRFSMRVKYTPHCIPFYLSFLSPRHHYCSASEFVSAAWHVLCLAVLLHLGCALCLTLSHCGRKSATKNSYISGKKNKTRANASIVVHSGTAFDRCGNGLFHTQSQPPRYQGLSYIRQFFVVALIVVCTVAVSLGEHARLDGLCLLRETILCAARFATSWPRCSS